MFIVCVYNGTVYRSGSAMGTSTLCNYCYCIEGRQKCIQPKCTLPAKGCEPILIDSSCCPIRYDCTEKKILKATYNTKYNRRRNGNGNKHYLRMTSRMQRSRGGCQFFQSNWYITCEMIRIPNQSYLQAVWLIPHSIQKDINCPPIKRIRVKFVFALVVVKDVLRKNVLQ